MAGEIFDFEWFINGAGYSLLRAEKVHSNGKQVWRVYSCDPAEERVDSQCIIAANLPPSEHIFPDVRYHPLSKNSCLFLTFSEIDPKPENILEFANEYGLLGLEIENPVPATVGLASPAEFVNVWIDEIYAMRQALDVWNMVLKKDKRGLINFLEPYMKWIEADKNFLSSPSTTLPHESLPEELDPKWLRWFRMNPQCLEWFQDGDVITPARCRVQAVINEHLEGRISPRVLWESEERRGWGLYFVPNSLVGALWLQLAQAVTHNKDYRRCRQCDSWFEIDHYTARSNRFFCSNACRIKAYRGRQQQARELYKQGIKLDEIAEQLGSDEKTVTGWVKSE